MYLCLYRHAHFIYNKITGVIPVIVFIKASLYLNNTIYAVRLVIDFLPPPIR
ncbi:hypothetical protein THIOM_002015 [Candidatus Thiomargarita nelsonii]|uniref:Uncharacterized protein n=1 Tax=Candidatus Thiomargarita nelsonii TaxID=1003181 RepID=A0A176S2R4_9GAMM|nr:hypothetical protein THIOM_002015 [Candidatus Thiomargarita nelsonii]